MCNSVKGVLPARRWNRLGPLQILYLHRKLWILKLVYLKDWHVVGHLTATRPEKRRSLQNLCKMCKVLREPDSTQ